MIDPKTLADKDVGRRVLYSDPASGLLNVEGTLTSWNDSYVFVRFRGPNGEACSPRSVYFLADVGSAVDQARGGPSDD